MITHAHRLSAILVAAAIVVGAPAATSSAEPDRGPHKSTPGGTNNDNHVRHGAEPDRSPHKSVPGGNNNDNHPRVGAEPDRSPHKFTPGDIGNQIAPITPGGGDRTPPNADASPEDQGQSPSTASPSEHSAPESEPATPQAQSPQTPTPQTQSPSPTAPTTQPPAETPAPSEPSAPAKPSTPAEPSTPSEPSGPYVDARSIPGSPSLPGSAITTENCPHGCAVGSRHSGTTRVFDLDNMPAGGDPRTTARVIDPDANDGATGTFSKNLITPNPLTNNGVGVPLPQGSEPNTAPGAGGRVNPARPGAAVDIQGRSQIRLRVVRAVPDKSYPVTTIGGRGVAVHYHYEYEAQTLKGADINGIHIFGKSGWKPVSPGQVNDFAAKGVPLPSVR